MRLLSAIGRREHGVNLLEAMVAIAIAGILLMQGLPALSDYMTNARLRSAGEVLLEQTLFAQNEAIRRNSTVSVTLTGSQVQVADTGVNPAVAIRSTELPGQVQFAPSPTSSRTVDFGSLGRPPLLGTSYRVELGAPGVTCGGEFRCPAVRVEAGGSVWMCADRSNRGACP